MAAKKKEKKKELKLLVITLTTQGVKWGEILIKTWNFES